MSMKRAHFLMFSLGAALLAFAALASKTNYVSDSGSALTPPYTSWELATADLQTAIDDAAAGDTVLVSNGIYKINAELSITNAITFKSLDGLAATTIARAASGDDAPQHRIIALTAAATVEGFTIENGRLPAGELGAGIKMSAGTVAKCLVRGNAISNVWNSNGGGVHISGGTLRSSIIVSNTVGGGQGGGVGMTGTALLISNTIAYNTGADGAGLKISPGSGSTYKVLSSVIEYNKGVGVATYGGYLSNCVIRCNSGGNGGGINSVNGNTILDCMIVSNTASSQGGGLYSTGQYSAWLMRGCVISDNTNAASAGVFMDNGGTDSGTRIFENCLIADNVGSSAVYLKSRPQFVKFRNCTIAAPRPLGLNVANLATNDAGTYLHPEFVNTIIYNHATNIYSADAVVLNEILTNAFRNCCAPQLTKPGLGNVTDDPLFAKPGQRNYRLKTSSPCAGTGATNVLAFFQRDLEQTPWNGVVNMGCYKTLVAPQGTMLVVR